MEEEEIKDLKYLFEECKDIMEDGYATIKLSLVKKLFDYYNHYNRKDAKQKREFENLQSQLKAKEEVIREAREYIENHSLYEEEYDYDDEDVMYLSNISDEQATKELIEILSKGESNDGGI